MVVYMVPIILFPFSFLISLIYLSIISLAFTIFRMIFPNKGSIVKANVHIDELIRALKPGGRNTRIELPKIDWNRIEY